MAEYFLKTLQNTGNFNVFAARSAQGYIRNYGVVLFPWLVIRPKHLDS